MAQKPPQTTPGQKTIDESTSHSKSPKIINSTKTVFLIDGSSFLYHSYYGLRPMHTSSGRPVQAVYNFCRMIKKLIETWTPSYLAIAWDSKGKTERHAIFPEYKATRMEPPSDLQEQKQSIQKFASLIGIHQIEQPGIEADDLMNSITLDCTKQGLSVILITSDKDMGQIVNDHIIVFDWFKNQFLDAAAFEQKFGFPVFKLPFYYAILGDTSDNIPGVKGIGKVGAAELVTTFESLDDLYNHLDHVPKERTRKLLEEQKQNAFLSYQLFLLRYHNLHLKADDLAFDPAQWPQAQPLFEELEFKSLLKDLAEHGVAVQRPKLSEQFGYTFTAITTEQALIDLASAIRKVGAFALDTEGEGLTPLQTTLVGLSIGFETTSAYYIPFGHTTGEPQLSRQTIFKHLKPLLEDTSIKKYLHHAKFDMHMLYEDAQIHGLAFDTLIAAHLVTKDWQRVGLKYLSEYYLHETMQSFSDVVQGNGYKTFPQVPLALATEYAAADALQTWRLVPLLEAELRAQNMEKIFYDIEFPLIPILYAMEQQGIRCDRSLLDELNVLVTKDLENLITKIEVAANIEGKAINLNSPKQLEQLLFIDLKLPPLKKTKTGYSTDQEVLEELAKLHPVPALIVKYRELTKLKNTYLDALPTFINPKDGKIHSSFSQTSVATGRLASSEPNMQNIPTSTDPYPIQIRAAFKPDDECCFISADYSQIELRVLAHLSQDQSLLDAFLHDRDIHTITAAKLFDVHQEFVTHEQRQLGKRINFSILYGLTPYGLSKDLNISQSDAKKYIERYFAQYPGVSAWMKNVIEETKQFGYVTTHWGRRRYIPGIYEKNKNLYDLACRVAINTKAQGTAAELMKLGMINISTVLATHEPRARIALQIHDELVINTPINTSSTIEPLIKETLERVVTWSVPLTVKTTRTSSWT